MADEPKLSTDESAAFGVSMRGWLALLITLTVCGMSAMKIKVDEPLYTLCTVAIGFYFGQKAK